MSISQKTLKTQKYETKELEPNHTLYLTENHILATELCEMVGIHMANISNLKLPSILKFGNSPIINKFDVNLPPKIRNHVLNLNLTTLKNKIPLTYFKTQYNLSNDEILTHIADRIEIIAGKKFIVYKDEFINKIKNKNKYKLDKMIYIANKSEFNEFEKMYNDLEYIKVNSKKYIILY